MKKFILGCILIAGLASCKKEIDELPDETQSGENTFGARINGTLWAPQGLGPIPANDVLVARKQGDDVTINARNIASSPNETEFYFFLKNVMGPGVYQLNSTVAHPDYNNSYVYYVKRNINPQQEWITTATVGGSVTITKLDVPNRIISGTFQFNMETILGSPTPMSITEGRFDIKYQ